VSLLVLIAWPAAILVTAGVVVLLTHPVTIDFAPL